MRSFRSGLLRVWTGVHSSPRAKSLAGLTVFGVLVLLRPVRFVRVGVLHGESIGGVISQIDLVLALRGLQQAPRSSQATDVFIVARSRANDYVVQKYIEALRQQGGTRILDARHSWGVRLLGAAFRGMEFLAIQRPYFRKHYCGSPLWEGIEGCGFHEDGRPWIRVEPDEEAECWRALAELGISRRQRIICFGVRDATYWSRPRDPTTWGPLSDGGGSTQDFRNTSLLDYLPAVAWLVDQGFTVVRMGAGAPSSPELDELGVVDYANSSQRSEVLDVFLFSQCHAAFFGGAYGLNQVALALHKPVCVVNFRPFMFTEWSTAPCLLVPSLLEEVATGRTLSVAEMLQHPFHVGRLYEQAGLRFVPNSPDEIRESIAELLARLDGSWRDSPEEETRQAEFWDAVTRSQPGYALYARSNGGTSRVNSRFQISDLPVTPRRSLVGSLFLARHVRELLGR